MSTPAQTKSKDAWIIFFGLFLVVGIGIGSFFRSKGDSAETKVSKDIPQEETLNDFQKISVEELRSIVLGKNIPEETVILDIRPALSWSNEHGIGSKNLPPEEGASFEPTEFEKKQKWIIIAPDTSSARRFITLLETRGIASDQIRVLDGTFETWKEKTGLVVGKADPTSPVDVTKVTLVTPEEAKAKIDRGGQWFILDVRSLERFSESHVTGATNIPLSELEEKRFVIPSTANIFVYGGDDRESFSAGVLLFDLGHFNTITLSAGFTDWKTKNLPLNTVTH